MKREVALKVGAARQRMSVREAEPIIIKNSALLRRLDELPHADGRGKYFAASNII